MSLTTVANLPSAATHTIGKLMVLAPRTSTLPKLLLKPGRWTVGSAATCSYQVAAVGVRPRHALLLCGQQSTVLKAWDAHTWHNDQPVNGEVRLQLGDRLTIGSVEFSIESPATFDVVGQLPDVPPAIAVHAEVPTDLTDLERLRSQIHELRDDLSQRMARHKTAVSIVPIEEAPSRHNVDTTNAHLVELEQSAAAARSAAEQTQQALADARSEHERREADWQQVADQWRATLDTTQNEVAELHHERDNLRAEAARREQAWQQQLAEWSAEREQWQDELLSLANARQQLAKESDQRQATLIDDAKRWQTECEQLRAESLQRQPAWDDERARMQDELRQFHETSQHAAQLAAQLAAQREQEFAEQSQRLVADRQQWDTERDELHALHEQLRFEHDQLQAERDELRTGHEQLRSECDQLRAERDQCQTEIDQLRTRHDQLQVVHDQLQVESEGYRTGHDQHEAEGLERAQAVAALNDERQRVEQQAAEVAATAEETSRRLAEFEQRQSELTREKLTLEHSWTWLQSDRRKLVEEKDEWQQQRAQWLAERESWLSNGEKLAAERSEFNAEQTAWSSQRDQFDSECRTKSDELAAIRAEFDVQQQTLRDEQTRLAELSADLEARTETLAHDRESVLADRRAMLNDSPSQVSEQVSPSDVTGAATDRTVDRDWTSDVTSMPRTWETESSSTDATLAEPWNIGVDLTAPRETLAADWSNSSKSGTEPTGSSSPTTLDNADVPADRGVVEVSSAEWRANATVTSTDSNSSEPSGGAWEPATPPPIPTPHDADTQLEKSVDPAVATLREMLASADLAVPRSDKSEVNVNSEAELPSANNETTIDPTPGPVVSILESLAFSDDEDIDDSVSRYMQHLLARSQTPGEAKLDRYVPAHSIRSTAATNAARELTPSQVSISDPSPAEESNSQPPETAEDRRIAIEELESIRATLTRTNPTFVQNKDEVRAVTQQMRQVANQQTVTNVEAANWKQLKGSIKNKMALATLAFLISGGLLYWGYQDQPKFLVLGACTSGLGIMTWLDLILDIRKARARTSRLAGRTTKPS